MHIKIIVAFFQNLTENHEIFLIENELLNEYVEIYNQSV